MRTASVVQCSRKTRCLQILNEMDEPFTLPLRPVINRADKEDKLPVQIAQINEQRGSFRNITEKSLQAEIKAAKEKGDEEILDQDEDTKPSESDATERLELLYKRRAEITDAALQAHLEATFALNFISLLLSKHTPRQGELSMSSNLKQLVPLGSLDVDVIKTPQQSESTRKDIQTIARGWKLESFNSASKKLLGASSKLENEVATETKYWEEVLAVKDRGWKVCRLPRERQALGVQYGFLEATSVYRERGLAPLRRADHGRLTLDRGLVPYRPRAVRVRVRNGGNVTGGSRFSTFVTRCEKDDPIEKRILQARDTLFEEELFHEVNRESRILASSGVTTRQNQVQFSVSEDQEVILDLIDIDDVDESISVPHIPEHDVLADSVSHALHILLSYAHRLNYRRRTQFPPPLTKTPRSTPEYRLLRPVIALIRHNAYVHRIGTYLRNTHQVLNSAGIDTTYTPQPFLSLNFTHKIAQALPTIDNLLADLLAPLESQFSATLANQGSSFTVTARTSSRDPLLSTEYEFSIHLPDYPHTQPPARLGLQDEVEELITHLVRLDLCSYISRISTKHMKASALYSSKNDSSSLLQTTDSQPGIWTTTFPHTGELSAVVPGKRVAKKLVIDLSSKKLILRTGWVGSPIESMETLYEWNSLAEGGKRRNFEEVVLDALKE